MEEYESAFRDQKDRPTTLLEIGIGRGGSLRYWADCFQHPGSKIVGIDRKLPAVRLPHNVVVYECDQNDRVRLKQIGEAEGPFDIVIDDASHQRKESENCFNTLWDYVALEGYYVIEDWAAGYWISRCKGLVELITNIIENAPKLKIKEMDILLKPGKAMAFFKKGKTGWKS